ncbi:MAG: G1 family glutamic endopeptidase [Planctomycetota bacterium]
MFFQPPSQVGRKTLKHRRLTLEHLENRALLSASPGISQLAGVQSYSSLGGAASYGSRATASLATKLYLVSQPVIQGGLQTTIQLYALDSGGRVVRNYNGTAALTCTDATATLPTPASVIFHNGQASFTVTFSNSVAEQPTITVTDSNANLTVSKQLNVTAPDSPTSCSTSYRSTVQSGVQTTVQIYALDASGYVVRNYNATVTLGQSSLGMPDSNATIPTTVVFHNGQASFKVTLVKAGAQTITLADSKAGLSTLISMTVAPPAAASSYSVNLRSRVQSGVPVTLQVLALDATGHRVPGYTGTATIVSSDGAKIVSIAGAPISLTNPVTFQNGIATVTITFTTVGFPTITVTDTTAGETVLPATATTDVVASLNPSPTSPTSPQATSSTNWSGYAAETNLRSPSQGVTAVSGSWTVPAVSGTGTAYSAVWVGIDGYQSPTVEQIGTESDVVSGVAQYSVWYELYPTGSVAITLTNSSHNSVAVAANDAIAASVQYVSGQFVLTITDSTNGGSFTTTQTAPNAQRSSAEWIVEAPSSNAGILPLANFGTVTFTNATATINGASGAIDNNLAWQSTAINMVSRGNLQEDVTSALTDTAATTTPVAPASSSFTVTYNMSGNSAASTSQGLGWGGGGWRKANVATALYAFNSPSSSNGSPNVSGNPLAALDALFATVDSFRG